MLKMPLNPNHPSTEVFCQQIVNGLIGRHKVDEQS